MPEAAAPPVEATSLARSRHEFTVIDLPSLLIGAGVGVGAGALGWWIWERRANTSGHLRVPRSDGRPGPVGAPPSPTAPAEPAEDDAALAPVASATELLAEPVGNPRPVRPGAGAKPAEPTLVISERVLLHLLGLPALGPYRAAELGRTQAGMCERLDIRQGSLTRVLARLEASGALSAERAHVEGVGQRLKVYTLTPLGESVARGIRTRRANADGPGSGGPRPPGRAGAPVEPSGPRRPKDPRNGSEPRLEYIR